MKKAIVLLLLAAMAVFQYVRTSPAEQDPFLITDYSRLRPVKVERVVEGKAEEQLVELVRRAKAEGKTLSIAGQRHSQGGHTYYEDGIVIDMTGYNKVLSLDAEAKRITVQSGATWEDVQKSVNPHGLSIKTMQSQNTFTIGGSISINAHGRDIRNGSLIESVESFRLLDADGDIINVSRTENPELFPLALGGYGLFGIILDVTLLLTDDEVYRESTVLLELEDYPDYFKNTVLPDDDIKLHIARISVAPGEGYFTELLAKSYRVDNELALADYSRLENNDKWVAPGKLLFNLNRMNDWGKNLMWDLQTKAFVEQTDNIVSRNNAMRAAWMFMEHSEPGSNDLLQEYFVPIDELYPFAQKLGAIVEEEELNLLNITVRYVNKDEEAVLSYAKEDMLALVCLFHTPLSKEAQSKLQHGVQRIIDEALLAGGSYYLPYASFATQEQFEAAYPRQSYFWQKKRQYDPEELFVNYFYEDYKS